MIKIQQPTINERIIKAQELCQSAKKAIEAVNDAMYDLEQNMNLIRKSQEFEPLGLYVLDQIDAQIEEYKRVWFDTSSLKHSLHNLRNIIDQSGALEA